MIPALSIDRATEAGEQDEIRHVSFGVGTNDDHYMLMLWLSQPQLFGLPADKECVSLHFDEAGWAAIKAYVDKQIELTKG